MLSDQTRTTYEAARFRLRAGDVPTYQRRITRLHRETSERQQLALEALIERDGASALFAFDGGRLVARDACFAEAA